MGIGKRVKQRRKEMRLTQQELADLIGVKQSTITAMETRDSTRSSYATALSLALGVTVEWLTAGDEPKYRADLPQTPGPKAPRYATPDHERLVRKVCALLPHQIHHLEPLVDDLLRLQALEREPVDN